MRKITQHPDQDFDRSVPACICSAAGKEGHLAIPITSEKQSAINDRRSQRAHQDDSEEYRSSPRVSALAKTFFRVRFVAQRLQFGHTEQNTGA